MENWINSLGPGFDAFKTKWISDLAKEDIQSVYCVRKISNHLFDALPLSWELKVVLAVLRGENNDGELTYKLEKAKEKAKKEKKARKKAETERKKAEKAKMKAEEGRRKAEDELRKLKDIIVKTAKPEYVCYILRECGDLVQDSSFLESFVTSTDKKEHHMTFKEPFDEFGAKNGRYPFK
eukprot:TRINITY_DN2481_c0_g1_i2.p1 TRINITY_DN2481_c0_g1~~TRINITY_DN2481_c0_g1_i2.p1  ORF type:complete len:180 (-),score=44.34 TRINITY_DN2481_c0_g1_i2:175-714(-)